MIEIGLEMEKMCGNIAEVEKVISVKFICDKMWSGFSQKYLPRAYYDALYETDFKSNVFLCHLTNSE